MDFYGIIRQLVPPQLEIFLMNKCTITTCIYIYIYRRYHTITDICTAALLLTKPSSDDDSGFRHGFGAEASLPLAQSAPAVSHNTIRLCQIVVTRWDCHVHADAIRALSWIFSMYFLLSDGGSPRLVKKMEVDLAIKPLHLTSIGNTFVIQPFLTHCSRRSSFFQFTLMCPVEIFFKRDRKPNNENFFCFNWPNDNIYIYIYIYIYILSSTDRSVLFYQNSSVWLDRLDSRSWDQNPVDSNTNPSFYHSATRKPAYTSAM